MLFRSAKKSADFRIADSTESRTKLQGAVSLDREFESVQSIDAHILKPDPLNEIHYYLRGVDYMNDRLDFALLDFTRAIEINPSFALAYFARANVYIRLHDYKKAQSDLEDTIALDPDMKWAYMDLAHVYTEQGRRDLSMKIIHEVLTSGNAEELMITENDPVWGYPFIGSW